MGEHWQRWGKVMEDLKEISLEEEYIQNKISKIELEKAKRRNLRLQFGTLSLITLIFTGYFIFFHKILEESDKNITTIIFSVSFSALFSILFDSKEKTLELEKKNLEEKMKRINGVDELNHFDRLVRINVNNLEEYYELVKKSNSNSFWTALIMSIIGVGIIIFGVIKGINNQGDFNSLAVASGLIVEIISGLLFYLYNRTIIQLKDYHDSLINVQNVLLAFKVIEQIDDENKKSEVLKQMIDGLITRK